MEDRKMERALEVLGVREHEAEAVDRLPVRPNVPIVEPSFYEAFVMRGIRVNQVEPGFVLCSFTVLPCHIDRSGMMGAEALATVVDLLGAAVITSEGHYEKPSVDMNIGFVSPAKLGDESEIRVRLLGSNVGMTGTHVLLTNKTTGQVVAKGRHSLFGILRSKI